MLFSSGPCNWLRQFAQRWFVHGGRRRRSRRVPTPTRRWARPRLEALEDRLTPSAATFLAFFSTGPIAPNQPSGAIAVQLEDSNFKAVTAASNVTVNLSSTSSTGQFLDTSGNPLANSSIVIPAGASFALFSYEDSQTGTPMIAATASGVPTPGHLEANVQGELAFTTPAQALATNQLSQPITVQLQDGKGNPLAATSAVTVNLSVNSFPNGGHFFDTSGNPLSTPSITIPAGSSSASFEYEDSQTGFPLLLAAQLNGDQVIQQESVGNPLAFIAPPGVLTPGHPSKPITVELENAASSDTTIKLSSTSSTGQFLDTSGNPLSNSSITIPAGSRSGSFEYEDSQTGSPSLEAFSSALNATAFLSEPVGGTSGLVNIVSPAQAMTPNQPAQITVQLRDIHLYPLPAENNLTLTLGSSSSTGQFLDTSGNPLANSSIVLPAGANTVSFEYQDSQVGIPKLTVSYPGFGGATQQTAQQEDVGASLVFTTATQTFAAGQTSQPITVQLQDSSGNPITASSDVTVNLISSRPVGSQFLDTSGNPLSFFGLTIPAGSSSASFEYKSVWGGTPTLTAGVGGTAPLVAPLAAKHQDNNNGLRSLVFTTPPTIAVSQTPQTSSLVTVQLEDNNGNPASAPSGGLSVNLSAFLVSSPATGLTFLDANGNPLSNSSLTIPAGSSTASFKFQYQTTVAAIPLGISAAVPNSPLAATQFATVQAGQPNSVAFSTSPRSVAAGVPSGSIAVSLHDQFGNLAEAGSGGVTINLSSSSTGGQFLSVSGDPLVSPSVTIPQGASTATIEYEDSQAGTPMLTAAANGLTSGTQTETITPVSAEIHVTNTNDSGAGSLRAAITAANAAPGSTIVFDAGVTGTIDLLSALPAITASANILGPGANVLTVERGAAATGTFGGFVVGTAPTILPLPGPTVILSGLTVANFDDTGIVNYGSLNLRQVVVNNNNASGSNLPPFGDPGGILNEAFTGYLTVLDSTISNNSTSNSLVAAGIDSEVGSVTIINSTITGNVDNGSNSAGGIGIYGGSAYIANSTISGNTATQQTGTNNNSGGGIDAPSSLSSLFGGTTTPSVTLYDTIVAGNTGSVNNPTDVSGAFTSLGNNLIGEANSQSSGFVSSDQVGTTTNPINPLLGSLAANGGPTPTMALLTGSPAIGGGSSANAPATDQRGDPRPTPGPIDIGAFELTPPSSNNLSLSPSSLPPDAVGAAYKQTITAGGGSGTVTLTTSGTLPRGLTFTVSGNQVTIGGRPRTSGTFKFSVTAKDSAGDSVTQNYTLTINTPVPINLNPTKLRAGKVGTVYNQAITASGGVGNLTVTYQVVSSSTLGLNFNVNGGELDITGTPTATGSVTFLVTATDPDGDITTHSYTLKIRP